MKADPQCLSVLRFIQRYAEARRGGLTRGEAQELVLDQKAHEGATVIPKEEQE